MKLLRKQPPNRRVLLATIPCVAGGIYYFGWRSLATVAVACAVAFLAEWLFCRKRNEPVSEATFVSAVLFSLIIPPTVGWHVVVVGMLVAIVFAKEVFGGYGRNIFNPAMAGRCFVYVCFAFSMTGQWAPNVHDLPDAKWYGALDRWSTVRAEAGEPYAVTSASPMGVYKAESQEYAIGEREDKPVPPRYATLWWGDLSGSMGVTSAMLILIGGGYLFITRTANRLTVITVIVSCGVLSQIYYWAGAPTAADALRSLLAGGFLFGAFFMATDPVSSPKTDFGRIGYGIIIGCTTATIRNFSVFNGGFMFSLLLGNIFAPTLDIAGRALQARKKAAEAAAQPKEAGA